jgi:hypothetical protein
MDIIRETTGPVRIREADHNSSAAEDCTSIESDEFDSPEDEHPRGGSEMSIVRVESLEMSIWKSIQANKRTKQQKKQRDLPRKKFKKY